MEEDDVNKVILHLKHLTGGRRRRGRPPAWLIAPQNRVAEAERGQEGAGPSEGVQGPPTDKCIRCSFCGKSYAEIERLISNPLGTARICDECIAVCNAILDDVTEKG
jgi:hypothetical protein